MKFKFSLKYFLLSSCTLLFFYYLNSSISTEVVNFVLTQDKEAKIEIPKEFEHVKFLANLEIQEADKTITRYLAGLGTASFAANAFYAANYFYLGASSPNPGTSAIVNIRLNAGTTPDLNTLEFVPLAPQTAYLNGIKENDKYVKKDNPVYDKRIDKLTLQSNKPVVTLLDQTNIEGWVSGNPVLAGECVCLIDNQADGSSVKTNIIKINDSNNAATNSVVGLAATSDKIIAAVKSNAGSFGDDNAGFAVLIQEDSKLKPINAQTGDNAGNLAVKLAVGADLLFAIDQAAASAGVDAAELGDMYWDSSLQRLFIGLKNAKKDNGLVAGGIVSILVGRFNDNGSLAIEPAISLTSALFTLDSVNHILGFYSNNDLRADVYKLKTMTTSTNKNYLIVNSSVGLAQEKNKIYALPILGIKLSDGTTVTPVANVGKVASKNNHDAVVAANADMTLAGDAAALVGGGALPTSPDDAAVKVTDIYVVNDTVFVSLSGDRTLDIHGNVMESGIFKSTAILNANGEIRAWSPWQRVMGNTDKVYGFGFDVTGANYWYFTGADAANANTAKITQWGKGVAQAGTMGNGLTTILKDEFTQANAGVHQIFNFDEYTPSIARTGAADRMSFMACLGYKKIALVQTGANVNAGGINAFTPTNLFEEGVNTFILNDQALNDLGPICCADVSRVNAVADSGWLFVGGYNGIAVLRKGGDVVGVRGKGWDGRVDQAAVNLATVAGWSFKEIGNFSNVRKLLADSPDGGLWFYVMTMNNLYRFEMDSEKFKDSAVVADLLARTITPPPGYLLDMLIFRRENQDTRLLVATTQGLFYSNAINDANVDKIGVNAPVWTRVNLNSGTAFSKPVAHLSFIDVQKGGYTTNGNLYALAADLALNMATVYRFDVNAGVITATKENSGTDYFYSFGELRSNFTTDGALGFSMLSKHFDKVQFLRSIRMSYIQSYIRSTETNLNLNVESNAYNIGVMTLNTASGGWVIPGDWGIRVSE
ncbi:MAG: hypothetical protein SZ59_C0002G0348 [candidate division TM6 bacterium GW2011_GWF2_28_16]|nr:MAG: hypothetical protein SZ59_C0002G0348 [candidate division TM6 bacterium GW2011_GWF2_28_16]